MHHGSLELNPHASLPRLGIQENIDQIAIWDDFFLNGLGVFQKELFIEIRNPHATPRHRISEKRCPDSNLGSLFLNDLGVFQKALFIGIRQGPYIRVNKLN